MNTKVSVEVSERLLRPAPVELGAIADSLPVISFGNPERSQVATVSLNPSWREFHNQHREWLLGSKLRLESLHSLGRKSVSDLSDGDIHKTVESCNSYFMRNPYKLWFNQLNKINNIVGADYYNGTACHLDLVQWATSEVQKNLGPKWPLLVSADKGFLRWQLETTSATTILINGKSSIEALVAEGLAPSLDKIEFSYVDKNGQKCTWTVQYAGASDKKFIGWNNTLAYGIPSQVRDEFFSLLTKL